MTQGDSLAEALDMVQEAIGLMLEDIEEKDYPAPSSPTDIATTGKQFVMMVSFYKLAYDKKYNAKAIKKNTFHESIPDFV